MTASKHYIRVKEGAEIYRTAPTGTPIIVRPGHHLLDGAGDGLISAGLALRERNIRGENLAGFIVETLHNPGPRPHHRRRDRRAQLR
ncbi:hypothetical protein FXW78_18765 [Rhodococcus opacus]|nr:hypothetical protein [Rhodococcus opacus]